eukprot:c2510_g1_i1 orf=199-621(+)
MPLLVALKHSSCRGHAYCNSGVSVVIGNPRLGTYELLMTFAAALKFASVALFIIGTRLDLLKKNFSLFLSMFNASRVLFEDRMKTVEGWIAEGWVNNIFPRLINRILLNEIEHTLRIFSLALINITTCYVPIVETRDPIT